MSNNYKKEQIVDFIKDIKNYYEDSEYEDFKSKIYNDFFPNYTKKDSQYQYILRNNSDIFRMILNSIYSEFINLKTSDKNEIIKKKNRLLTYNEFRNVFLVRNPNFDFIKHGDLFIENLEQSSFGTIDYSILEVIEYFNLYIKDPQLIDNLIQVHNYTKDLWKNGSKFMHFYTLHNHEHAVDLIKNATLFLKSIEYFSISKMDYYILFNACYLHDISMVIFPNFQDLFLSENFSSNLIFTDFNNQILEEINKQTTNINSIKKIFLDLYQEIDSFFENEVRSNHTKQSAKFIREKIDFSFLECIKETIAKISEAHGYDFKDIYGLKSKAKEEVYSLKFCMIALRFADLLDITKKRITQTILDANIDSMPPTSQFHWLSHQFIEDYSINTNYEINEPEKKPNNFSFLQSNVVKEKFNIEINLSINNQLTIENPKKCESFVSRKDIGINGEDIDDNKTNIKEEKNIIHIVPNRNIEIKNESNLCFISNKKCNYETCTFICKWMQKKNEYLYQEVYALDNYLQSNPNNHFDTSITIDIILGDQKLTSKQEDIIKANFY